MLDKLFIFCWLFSQVIFSSVACRFPATPHPAGEKPCQCLFIIIQLHRGFAQAFADGKIALPLFVESDGLALSLQFVVQGFVFSGQGGGHGLVFAPLVAVDVGIGF